MNKNQLFENCVFASLPNVMILQTFTYFDVFTYLDVQRSEE